MEFANFYVNDCRAKTWTLYPFGDIQFGAPGFNNDLWKKYVNDVLSDPYALTMGVGDYSDHWRPTNQNKLDSAAVGDGDFKASIDEMHRAHMQKVFDKLAPVVKKGRCLGLLAGHHDYTYISGITATQELCEKLRVNFLGRMAFVRLVFRDLQTSASIKIHAQHGDGGAGMIGSDIANLERKTAPYWDADLLLRGHSTKHWAACMAYYDMTSPRDSREKPRLLMKDRWICNTGGFMNGYIDGQDTYVSKKNMPPARLGYIKVHLKFSDHFHGTRGKYCQQGKQAHIPKTQ